MLFELALCDHDRSRVGVEQDGAGRGRPLIDRQDMIGSHHATVHKDAGHSPEEGRGLRGRVARCMARSCRRA